MLGSPVSFDFVERLSKKSPSILLLSAIPAQRREHEFLKLLSLLEPDRYDVNSDQERKEFRKLYAQQIDIGRRLRLFDRRLEGLENGKFTVDDVVAYTEKLFEIPSLDKDKKLHSDVEEIERRPSLYIRKR